LCEGGRKRIRTDREKIPYTGSEGETKKRNRHGGRMYPGGARWCRSAGRKCDRMSQANANKCKGVRKGVQGNNLPTEKRRGGEGAMAKKKKRGRRKSDINSKSESLTERKVGKKRNMGKTKGGNSECRGKKPGLLALKSKG